jgi:hypothetical protein
LPFKLTIHLEQNSEQALPPVGDLVSKPVNNPVVKPSFTSPKKEDTKGHAKSEQSGDDLANTGFGLGFALLIMLLFLVGSRRLKNRPM